MNEFDPDPDLQFIFEVTYHKHIFSRQENNLYYSTTKEIKKHASTSKF